ncbi:hypothetical protein B005_3386 [Nocardiopsis alba ATCC BAA-2165]|uniref:Uncharacterized protein n=1 Tax=Nocardiopsis alba (strain ATCC BAA-2165 / BE74) TaxID=1205910 RepID=J7LAA3_NOCAA|nr:hypothetical protein B005_3386 [Nocardiopsis alba ATCC BAA-2165]
MSDIHVRRLSVHSPHQGIGFGPAPLPCDRDTTRTRYRPRPVTPTGCPRGPHRPLPGAAPVRSPRLRAAKRPTTGFLTSTHTNCAQTNFPPDGVGITPHSCAKALTRASPLPPSIPTSASLLRGK